MPFPTFSDHSFLRACHPRHTGAWEPGSAPGAGWEAGPGCVVTSRACLPSQGGNSQAPERRTRGQFQRDLVRAMVSADAPRREWPVSQESCQRPETASPSVISGVVT